MNNFLINQANKYEKKIIVACCFPFALVAQHTSNKLSFYLQAGYRSSTYIKEAGQGHIVSEAEDHRHGGLGLLLPMTILEQKTAHLNSVISATNSG